MTRRISRREAIKVGTVMAATAASGTITSRANADVPDTSATRRRALRLAHVTDVHIQPERRAGEGMIACLHHLQALRDPPQLILNGGDSVMDSFEADDARTTVQWNLWRSVLKNECGLPIEHCIGNHDVWGWHRGHSKTTGKEPNHGKKRAIEMYDIPDRYRSFDRSGWHFIVLDSTFPDGEGYKARLDDEQFEWLKGDLKSMNPATPVTVLSHMPIVSATPIVGSEDKPQEEWKLGWVSVHVDAVRLKNLFNEHRNVKLCLSGHMHLVERLDYNGVTYLCNGAVSGAWWKGKNHECSEGYAVIDLYEDGSFNHEYITYGWKA